MIEYVSRSGPPEAMNCPAFVCDVCGEQVTERGNVEWAVRFVDHKLESSPLFVSHKGCSRALRKLVISKVYTLDKGWSILWNDISEFLEHLKNNFLATGSFKEDKEGEYKYSRKRF